MMNLLAPLTQTTLDAPFEDVRPDPMRAAYDRLAPAIAAVPDRYLRAVDLDVSAVVGMVLTNLPALRGFRGAIVEHTPTFDIVHLDDLGDHALALAYLHEVHARLAVPRPELPALHAEALALRDTLLAAARELVRVDLLDPQRVDAMGAASGYRKLGHELDVLAQLLRENERHLVGDLPFTPEQLRRADDLVGTFARAVSERESDASALAAVTLARQRAFVLFQRAYGQVRRALVYACWSSGTSFVLTPPLYGDRRTRERSVPAASRVATEASWPNDDPAFPAAEALAAE